MTKPFEQQPTIFTFDLFDTLITRNVLTPEDIFTTIGKRLEIEALWSTRHGRFRDLRIAADKLTRRKLRMEEITLPQIYQTLATKAGWNADQAQRAMSIEIEEEIASVRPILEMRQRWNAIDPALKAIVSDTYFGLDVIQKMLVRCGIQCDEEHLFLSSVLCRRKSTGRLFRVVSEKLGAEPALIHHTGDNEHSDFASARKEGFSAELYQDAGRQRFDEARRQIRPEESARIQGALRVARLSFPGGTATERTLWEVGTQVAGPVLFSYISWVLEMARREKLEHLYFLARDGQILLQLAQKIDPQLPSSYLLASRQAWHLPSIVTIIDENTLSWIADGHARSSLRNILTRVDVRPEEINDLLKAHGFEAMAWEQPVKDRKQLERLFAEASLTSLIVGRAKSARDRIEGYLQGEGVLTLEKIGIVDLGWNGRLQRSLSRLLDEIAPSKPRLIDGFYFSLKQGSREDESGHYHAYVGPDFARRPAHAMLMELFCSADHGGLLGFTRDSGGHIQPVLAQEKDDAVIAWGLPLFQRAILEAADQLLFVCQEKGLKPANIGEALRNPALASLEMLASKPSISEAEAFGRFPFTYDQNHAEIVEMAPQITSGQALAMMVPATVRAKQRSMWMQGTLVRSVRRLTSLALQIFRWRDSVVRLLQRV